MHGYNKAEKRAFVSEGIEDLCEAGSGWDNTSVLARFIFPALTISDWINALPTLVPSLQFICVHEAFKTFIPCKLFKFKVVLSSLDSNPQHTCLKVVLTQPKLPLKHVDVLVPFYHFLHFPRQRHHCSRKLICSNILNKNEFIWNLDFSYCVVYWNSRFLYVCFSVFILTSVSESLILYKRIIVPSHQAFDQTLPEWYGLHTYIGWNK